MPISGREAALKALIAFRRSGSHGRMMNYQALNNISEQGNIEGKEASLAYRLFFGVLQNIYLCDYYINFFLSSGIDKLQPVVKDILRLSAYQIIFLTRIPKSAAVNEGVELTKKYANKAASSLVNAVLRRISENSDKLPEIKANGINELLSIKHSHPVELTDYLIQRLGYNDAELFLKHDNEIAPVMIRVNKLKTTAEELAEELSRADIDFKQHSKVEGFFELFNAGSPDKLTAFNKGLFTVQDPSSALAVTAAGLKKDMHVLDCCAAPGGKTFYAAQLMQNSGSILSCDINEKKLRHISEGAKRLGIDIVQCARMDASKPDPDLVDRFDAIICDAPCSGFGVIAKKPEIRYKPFKSVEELPRVQLTILNNVAAYLKAGGTLLYSTCTVLERENEEVINSFLNSRDDFILETFELPEVGEAIDGHITLWPHIHKTDGFFIAKLIKK